VSGPHTKVSGVESGSRVASVEHGQGGADDTDRFGSTPYASNGNTDDTNDTTYDTNNTDVNTYASNGISNADNEGNDRSESPDVEQLRYQRSNKPSVRHLSGTNNILNDGGGTGKEKRGAWLRQFREVLADEASHWQLKKVPRGARRTSNQSLWRVGKEVNRKEGVWLIESAPMRAFGNISSECMLLRSQLDIDKECAKCTSQLGFDRWRITVRE
jgi:hypothetical protein